jgi:hypothetical protein
MAAFSDVSARSSPTVASRLRCRSLPLGVVLASLVWASAAAPNASAAAVSPDALGVNVITRWVNDQFGPTNLSLAAAAGVGVARVHVNEGDDIDEVVKLTAEAHMRLYPVMGLPCPPGEPGCSWSTS